jgi:hypothetical protein
MTAVMKMYQLCSARSGSTPALVKTAVASARSRPAG